MKNLIFSFTAALAFTITAYAQNLSAVNTLTGGTPVNVFSTPQLVDDITITATSTNVTTVRVYDAPTSSTNIVQAAYVRYASYNTNIVQVYTNENNVVLTNTFSGIYTYPISVSVSTNQRPVIATLVIPGSGTRTKSVRLVLTKGMTVLSDQNAILETDYRNNP